MTEYITRNNILYRPLCIIYLNKDVIPSGTKVPFLFYQKQTKHWKRFRRVKTKRKLYAEKIKATDKESGGSPTENNTRDIFFFLYNSPDNVYSDDLTTPKRTK